MTSLWQILHSYILDVRRVVQQISNLQDSDFQRSIDDYIGVNFRKIVCSDQLLEFSKEDVSTFLSMDSLDIAEEDEVFDCLMA